MSNLTEKSELIFHDTESTFRRVVDSILHHFIIRSLIVLDIASVLRRAK